MIVYHKHHIIPEHVGGTNDPSNIVELTVEEHAEAHKQLYEQYGNEYDRIAWQGLLKMIGHEEAVRQALKESGKRTAKKRVENGTNPFLDGETAKKASKKRIEDGTFHLLSGEIQRRAQLKRVAEGTNPFVGPEMNRRRLEDGSHHLIQPFTCSECGRTIKGIGNYNRHLTVHEKNASVA